MTGRKVIKIFRAVLLAVFFASCSGEVEEVVEKNPFDIFAEGSEIETTADLKVTFGSREGPAVSNIVIIEKRSNGKKRTIKALSGTIETNELPHTFSLSLYGVTVDGVEVPGRLDGKADIVLSIGLPKQ